MLAVILPLATLALATLALTPQANAQLQFDELGKRHLPIDTDETASTALGDVDGDGDLDLVFGTHRGQDRLYVNDGTGIFTDVTTAQLPTKFGFTWEVALRDVDGDGDNDWISADERGQNRLYLNDGNGKFTDATSTHLPVDRDKTSCMALGDVDGDGDLDLVYGNRAPHSAVSGGQNRLYLNDGNGKFVDVTAARLPSFDDGTFAVALADVDGDRDLDLVVANYLQQNRLLLNDGLGTFTDVTGQHMPFDDDPTRDLALGDVDFDGDVDLVCGNSGGGPRPGRHNRLYLNDGTGAFVRVTAAQFPAGHGTGVEMGDVDADGDLDIVFCSPSWGTGSFLNHPPTRTLYVNDGTGTFADATATQMPSDLSQPSSVAMGDADGDGDPDLVFGGYHEQNRLYSNDGQGTFADATAVPMVGDFDQSLAVAIGDVDGDGDLDVIFGNFVSRNRLYLNDGIGGFSDATAGRLPVDSDMTNALALGDVDGDGDLDLICGNGHRDLDQQNRLYLNDGNGTFTDGTTGRIPIILKQTLAVALVDVNGDGSLDLICGNSDWPTVAGDQNRLYFNDGLGTFTDVTATRLPATIDRTNAIAVDDVDGDGDPDLVFGNGRVWGVGNGEQNRLHLNDGTGKFREVTATQLPIDDDRTSAVALGDVDGDGDVDLICGNGSYRNGVRNRLYLNDGGGTFTDATATLMPFDIATTSDLVLADLDEDGDLDLMCGNGSWSFGNQNRLLLNDGTGAFVDVTSNRLPVDTDPTSALALGDVDGDGDPDVVAANLQRQNRVFWNLRRHLSAPLLLIPGRRLQLDAYARDGASIASDTALPYVSIRRAAIRLPPLGTLHLDPTQMIPLPSIAIPNAAGMGSIDVPVPNLPSLVGLPVFVQALFTGRGRLTNVTSDTVAR